MAGKTNLTTMAKACLVTYDEHFEANWESFPKEYSMWNTMRGKDQIKGYYDTTGNLVKAVALADGANFPFEAITQAYQTTITSAPFATGLEITWSLIKEASKISNIIDKIRVYGVASSMLQTLEETGIKPWNDAFTENLTSGVPALSATQPCSDTAGGTTYSNLATGALSYANIKTALKLFPVQKNGQGYPVPTSPNRIMTHALNQMDLKEIFDSSTFPSTSAATSQKNVLPKLDTVFSHYLTSTTAWFLEDNRPDRAHGICQYLNSCPTPENKSEIFEKSRGIGISSGFFMGAGMLPNIGLVGSTGL